MLQQEEADCVSAPMLSALFPDAAIDASATTGRRTAVAALAMHVAGDAIVFISSICKESICWLFSENSNEWFSKVEGVKSKKKSTSVKSMGRVHLYCAPPFTNMGIRR